MLTDSLLAEETLPNWRQPRTSGQRSRTCRRGPSRASSSSCSADRRRWICSITSRSFSGAMGSRSTMNFGVARRPNPRCRRVGARFVNMATRASGVPTRFPNIAQHMDKLAVVKSLYSDSFAHGSALLQMNSGRILQGHPSVGAWINYGLGAMNRNLPAYRGDARSARRADDRPAKLVERLHAGRISGDGVAHDRRADSQPDAAGGHESSSDSDARSTSSTN